MWHVAPSCWNQILPISSSLIFMKKNWFNMARSPLTVTTSLCSFLKKNGSIMTLDQSAPNSDSFWVHRVFNVCMRVFCAPNSTILLLYIPKIKMSFIWNDDSFFFAKIGIFCKSIARPFSEAYTQPYSLGGRIKLIICQIRLELSVTIHKRSTS